MRGIGQGRSGRQGAGRGRGRGSFRERFYSDTTSQPQIQPIGVVGTSLQTGQSSNPSKGPLQTQQMQRGPIQRTSPETQSSRNLNESVRLSVEAKTGADNIDKAVGSGDTDIVNYCGWIMRTTFSFRDGSWQNIVLKHGEAMWYRVKISMRITSDGIFTNRQKMGCDDECFFSGNLHYCVERSYLYLAGVTWINLKLEGLPEHKLQGFVISTMQRLFRSWKARLHVIYSSYNNDKD
ncbi:hypothetical protein CQW23_29109 [Capsicum baccatum]|uniref:Uncharacterized protein n=1 Tax=Capsicum baccatum TaxID=33114 RepID=A0A2G2VII0_CAPBA|nr:hypothetical protein CQW23_29109 [Capsicum baccatum]